MVSRKTAKKSPLELAKQEIQTAQRKLQRVHREYRRAQKATAKLLRESEKGVVSTGRLESGLREIKKNLDAMEDFERGLDD